MGPIPPLILKENDPPKDDMANDEDFMDNINLENIDGIVENGHAFRGNNNLEDLANVIMNFDAFRENINLENAANIMNVDIFRGNINLEDENDIIVNDNAFRENINLENIDDIIANGDAFRGNINHENGDDIIPNNDAFRENINRENDDDIMPNDDAFRGNNYFQNEDDSINEDDIIPNDDVFRGFNHFQEYVIPNDNVFAENNENEDNKPPLHMLLFTPTLEHIKNVLYIALHQFFDEFEIAVVSCPRLTKPPYGFAAAGLAGNTGILQMGDLGNFNLSLPQTDFTFDIQSILSSSYYDSFVIGSGFAAKPFMPYNGHLIINAMLSANPTNVINNSSIVYENADTGQKISQIINDPNQMKCSILGNFYFSEGKSGMVIKMRVKGRKTLYEVQSLIQYSLYVCCPYRIGLGGIITINGGAAILYITPEDYPEWLKLYCLDDMNLIAVGALINFPFFKRQKSDGSREIGTRYRFNTFSNYEAAGGFRNDFTPDETEYICYFNIAQRIYF